MRMTRSQRRARQRNRSGSPVLVYLLAIASLRHVPARHVLARLAWFRVPHFSCFFAIPPVSESLCRISYKISSCLHVEEVFYVDV